MPKTTHFGYQQVRPEEKARRVAGVFRSVAGRYDLMNDLMSFGVHRLWKRFTLGQTFLRPGQAALDLAGGTGDLAVRLSEQVGDDGTVVLADINASMLEQGRARMLDAGKVSGIDYAQADAENLPFKNDHFDCITMAFGLRNVTDKDRALGECLRVLRPGGRLLVLEFSKPVLVPLARLYDRYSFNVVTRLGEWVTGDRDSYQYLVESIHMRPGQPKLHSMMDAQGFARTGYFNLSGGIVALHRGYKL
jgi:demethylmenaquinone methyltransferase/2-methoxy-6-polyprenyl-1,4-benzoquinol methylase